MSVSIHLTTLATATPTPALRVPDSLMELIHPIYMVAPISAIIALVTAFLIAKSVMKKSEGDPEMIRIAQAVRDGAGQYLRSQSRIVAGVFAGLVVVLFIMWQMGLEPAWAMVGVPLAGFLSFLSGWFGMKIATNASARTAHAAKESLNSGLQVAFRSGAVMGLTVVGLALLDVSFWFFIFTGFGEKYLHIDGGLKEMVAILISYKMGASLQALFARVGGGIFTKAADVGADLVGKVEAGIPEDDARNPATIADNVGDNVGDVAGMGADLYESYYSSIIAAIALGIAGAFSLPGAKAIQLDAAMKMATLPIILAGFGVLASIIAIFTIKTKDDAGFKDLLKALERGVWVASALLLLASFGVPYVLLGNTPIGSLTWYGIGGSISSGLIAGLVIARWTEYCTSYEYEPTRRIARQAITGPATVIISGIAEGMKSTWACLISVVIAILLAFKFSGGAENYLMGLYGVGIAAVGMLATLGITLATDAYGPIADNAGGNAEMSGQDPEVRERTDLLDAIGNTTAATGKGFAIGSAALTALALLAAYLQVVQTKLDHQGAHFAEVQITETAPPEAIAIYEGYGVFGIAAPNINGMEFGGALVIDKDQPTFHDLNKGDRFRVAEATGGGADENITDAIELVLVTDDGATLSVYGAGRATIGDVLEFYNITLINPSVMGGLFIGVMLTFLFCALTMNAVGRAANLMMRECRRQFGKMREAYRSNGLTEEQIADPMQWPKQVTYEGVEYPDYSTCVKIATGGALREMVIPSLLAIIVPVSTGLVLGVAGVTGLLAGGLISGFALAVFMANAGGAWDNAKKLLESYGKITADDLINDKTVQDKVPSEILDSLLLRAKEFQAAGNGDALVYGKGSDDHKALVVGDTVGDPFKDTSGPSLNILIKLLSSVAVVFAGIVVKYGAVMGDWLGIG